MTRSENKSPDGSSRLGNLSPEKRALLDKLLKAKAQEAGAQGSSALQEPIAVIGLACRFPGHADNPSKLWRLLMERFDASCELPNDRWREANPELMTDDFDRVRRGGFLQEKIDEFEPEFFAISPVEAKSMDPQQRVLMETAWEAFEDAGQTMESLRHSPTGVFVGAHTFNSEYFWWQMCGRSTLNMYTSTGGAHSILANRISYWLDLRGPSVSLDTACSSSLVALHLACQSLATGDCELAIAGGVNVINGPEASAALCGLNMLAPDGRCKTFDAGGDGFARSEGAGLIVLKRLKDAERDGDSIRAIIRATAVNQDGATNGITAPNGLAQQEVVRLALQRAGLKPEAIGYIETHGTGTVLGDPIEVEALKEVFGNRAENQLPCVLGALKSNIGHLEGAAGIAGVIKVILALGHDVIPPNIHFKTLNPHISLDRTPFVIPITETPWAVEPAQRFAGVSSYGFGGTNAHTILQGYRTPVPESSSPGPYLLPLSARTEPALRALAGKWKAYLEDGARPTPPPADLCRTLGAHRTHFAWRAAIIGENAAQWIEQLATLETGDSSVPVHHLEEGSPAGSTIELPSARPCDRDALERIGKAWLHGGTADWKTLYPESRIVGGLPTTAWQRKPYWLKVQFEQPAVKEESGCPGIFTERRIESPLIDATAFNSTISTESPTLLNEHRLFGAAVFPATAMIETAAQALRHTHGGASFTLRDMVIHEALMLSDREATQLHTTLTSEDSDRFRFQLHSRAGEGAWKLHAEALLDTASTTAPANGEPPSTRFGKTTRRFSGDQVYASFHSRGVEFGPQFRHIQELGAAPGEIVARIEAPSIDLTETPFIIHPALLDACLQGIDSGLHLQQAVAGSAEGAFLPVTLDRFTLHKPLTPILWAHIRFAEQPQPNATQLTASIAIYNRDSELVAEIEGLLMRRAGREKLISLARRPTADWTYRLDWQPQSLAGPATAAASTRGWVLLAEDSTIANAMRAKLTQRGDACIVIDPAQISDANRIFSGQLTSGRAWELIVCTGGMDADSSSLSATASRLCANLTECIKAINVAQNGMGLPTWLITRGAAGLDHDTPAIAASALWGLGQVVTLEHPELKLMRIDLDPAASFDQSIDALIRELDSARLAAAPLEDQVAHRDDQRLVARLRPHASGNCIDTAPLAGAEAFEMLPASDGVLDHLTLCPATRRTPGPSEIEIRVQAAGMNFRDVLNALKMMEGMEVPLGAECCGEVTAVGEGVEHLRIGDIAMAFAPGAMRSHITLSAAYAVRKPAALSPADAAAMPVVFLTVLYAFQNLAQLQSGQRVLIHAATGGVGQAAVQIARMIGAEIFATAGSPEKRDLLRAQGIEHVFDSRSLDFSQQIVAVGTQGIDVVLNSLTGDFIPHSMRLLRPGGMFIELGKREILDAAAVATIRADIRYKYFDLSQVAAEHPPTLAALFAELLTHLASGALQPPPTRVYPLTQARDAFKFMAQARHIGKLVLQFTPSKFKVDPAGTYLITGGLGAIGLATGRWLAARGAKHLALLGRSGVNDETRSAVDALIAMGSSIEILQADVADRGSLATALDRLRASGRPLRGVFHSAGVLDDGIILKQDAARYARVMAPKIDGAWNLHELTLNDSLDAFVLYSSVAATLGWGGQGGYAAANTAMDGIAHHRRQMGLPALTLNWGPWASEGMAAGGTIRSAHSWFEAGFDLIDLTEGVEALEWLLAQPNAQLIPVRMRWADYARRYPDAARRPLLSQLVKPSQPSTANAGVSSTKSAEPGLIDTLLKAAPGERHECLMNAIEQQARVVLEFESDQTIGRTQPLHDLGLDSLLTVELRNRLGAAVGQPLPASILFDCPTVKALADFLMKNVEALKAADSSAPSKSRQPALPAPDTRADAEWLDDISDEEAEKLLLRELEELGSDV